MSDENITAGEYLRRQFAHMNDRFDRIDRKLDEALGNTVATKTDSLDVVLLRLLDRVRQYEDQIRAVEDALQRLDTRLRALEGRE